MTVTQTDPRPHMTAILAALNTALSPNAAYALDGVPGTKQNAKESERVKSLPNIYAEVNLAPRSTPAIGLVPRERRGAWRVTTVCVGRSINEAFWAMDRVDRALRNQFLVIDGERVGPFVRETIREPEWDNVRWSSLITWTYST